TVRCHEQAPKCCIELTIGRASSLCGLKRFNGSIDIALLCERTCNPDICCRQVWPKVCGASIKSCRSLDIVQTLRCVRDPHHRRRILRSLRLTLNDGINGAGRQDDSRCSNAKDFGDHSSGHSCKSIIGLDHQPGYSRLAEKWKAGSQLKRERQKRGRWTT